MVKPSLPHHGPSVLERWHRSFHPPNPWYPEYRQHRRESCSRFAASRDFFLIRRIALLAMIIPIRPARGDQSQLSQLAGWSHHSLGNGPQLTAGAGAQAVVSQGAEVQPVAQPLLQPWCDLGLSVKSTHLWQRLR